MPTGPWLNAYIGLWILLLLVAGVLIAVLRQLRVLHEYWVHNDPEWGLPLGAMAPALPARDVSGRALGAAPGDGQKILLAFLSRGCHSCRQTIAAVGSLAQAPGFPARTVLVVSGSELQTRLFVEEHGGDLILAGVAALADPASEIKQQYKVSAVPYVVVVDEDGCLGAKGTGGSLGHIGVLITQSDELRRRRREAACDLAIIRPAHAASQAIGGAE